MKSLIKYHFTVVFLHLLVTSCIFLTKYDNITKANLPYQSVRYSEAVTYVNAYLIVSMIMLAFQLLFTSIGLTYSKGIFSIQIVLQMVGIFAYACFVLMKMNYLTIAYMWGVFCFVPFVLDVVMIVASLLKNKKYVHVDA